MKCAIGRSAFEVDLDRVADEYEYGHELFCCYEYGTGLVYDVDEQVGYVSERHRRTYRAYEVHMRPSAMTMEQYPVHSALYAEKPAMYVKDTWMSRACSPQPVAAVPDAEGEGAHEAYNSYVVSDESTVPLGPGASEPATRALHGFSSSGFDLQPILDPLMH